MVLVAKVTCNTVNIVIVNKVVGVNILINTAVLELSLKRVSDFKVVVVVVARVDSLVALVVCNRVEHLIVSPAAVVAADNLAVKPEIGLFASAKSLELSKEIKVNNVCGVKAQTVNIKLVNPEVNSVKQIVYNVGIFKVKLYEVVVT